MGNTPKLRFEGFTDEWEERKLKDAFDFLQNNTLSRADLSLESGAAKNVHYGDVLVKFGEYLDATETALPYIPSQHIVEKYKASALQDGDIIMADTAEDQTVGKCTEIANLQGFPTISGLHTIPLRPKDKYAKGFLGYFMNSGAYHDQLLPLMQGIKVTSISKGALLDTNISYPSDSDEQAAIGQYFINLDHLIALHQRKSDALTKAKAFYLQNLFPQEGEKEPKLRLEGFTDFWNQYSLGDLYTERNERGNETLQILTVSIHTGVSDGALEEDELGKSVRRSEDKTLYKHVYAGDLIFNMMRAWQGAIGVAKREGMISPAYISAIPDERVYPPFMNYLLRRKEIISQINNLSYGVTDFRKRLYWDSFIKVKCSLPSVEEQKCITDVFEQLDTLITRQEHRIKALRTMKKFMLQNMFPQEG